VLVVIVTVCVPPPAGLNTGVATVPAGVLTGVVVLMAKPLLVAAVRFVLVAERV
jgi:hypothetical protein